MFIEKLGRINWQSAFDQVRQDFAALSPQAAASKSGAEYRDGAFQVPLFDQTYLVRYPEGTIEPVDGSEEAPPFAQLFLLHYLITADGTSLTDRWLAFRELPGAAPLTGAFQSHIIAPLARAFATDVELFRKAGQTLGGWPLTRSGDAGFRFHALPRLVMGCTLYLADEEFPGNATILYDASASHYLHTEDLFVLGGHLSEALRRAAGLTVGPSPDLPHTRRPY